MTNVQDLVTIASQLSLAPIRDALREGYEEEIDGEFPVAAFASRPLSSADAWSLWRTIRSDDRLKTFASLVVAEEAEVFQDTWDVSCRKVAHRLGLRRSVKAIKVPDPQRARRWVESKQVRYILRQLGIGSRAHHGAAHDIADDDLEDDLFQLLCDIKNDREGESAPPTASVGVISELRPQLRLASTMPVRSATETS